MDSIEKGHGNMVFLTLNGSLCQTVKALKNRNSPHKVPSPMPKRDKNM